MVSLGFGLFEVGQALARHLITSVGVMAEYGLVFLKSVQDSIYQVSSGLDIPQSPRLSPFTK